MESVTRITEEGEDGNIDSAEEESTHSDAEAADVRPFPRRSNRLTQQSRLDSDSSSSPEPSVAERTQKLFKDLTFYYIPKCSNNPDLKMLIEVSQSI